MSLAADTLLRSPLVRYGALSFAYFLALGVFNPYSPLWLQSMGFSTLAIGAIASLQSWTRIVVPYGWSWLGDHSGQRVWLLRAAALGALCSAALLLTVREYAGIAVAVLLLFAFNGAIVPLSEASVGRYLSQSGGFDAGRYGRVRVWGSVGFIAGVMGAGWLLETLSVQFFGVLVLVVYVLLLAGALALPGARDTVRVDTPAPPVLPMLKQPALRWFFLSVAFTVLAHSSLYAFLSLYLEHLGYDKAQVGLMWAVSVVCEVAFFWWQGHWFARLTPWQWLMLVGAITALRFALLATAGQVVWVLLITQMSHAITFAAHHAACITLVNQHFTGRLRGRGMALYTTLGYGIPGVIGGVAGGWLLQHWGYGALFAAASAAGALAGLCAWRGRLSGGNTQR